MTILGKHTIGEIRDLARTIEFRINAVFALIGKVNGRQGAGTPGIPLVDAGVIDTWNTWLGRWRRASNSVLPLATAISISNPLVPADAIAAEDLWVKLKCAINVGCQDTSTLGDMGPAIRNVEIAAEEPIDERNAPQPSASDPDLAAFNKLDAAIKAGEKAAKAAKEALTPDTIAKKVPWWVWLGGALGVTAVGYSVVRTGQGVAAKAKRDTEYIHEKMTSKVLPGYKG